MKANALCQLCWKVRQNVELVFLIFELGLLCYDRRKWVKMLVFLSVNRDYARALLSFVVAQKGRCHVLIETLLEFENYRDCTYGVCISIYKYKFMMSIYELILRMENANLLI